MSLFIDEIVEENAKLKEEIEKLNKYKKAIKLIKYMLDYDELREHLEYIIDFLLYNELDKELLKEVFDDEN